MFKKIIIVLILIIASVLVVAAFRPTEMTVTREMTMAATPEAIFPYINNSAKSYEWMPWAEGDPQMKLEYTGPTEGVGTASNWNGEQMGVGASLVTESIPNQLVKTQLTYVKPFAMSQLAEISLTPVAGGTNVRWSVTGHNNFFFRLMGLFVNCDNMIGDEFTKGLNKLKGLVEKP